MRPSQSLKCTESRQRKASHWEFENQLVVRKLAAMLVTPLVLVLPFDMLPCLAQYFCTLHFSLPLASLTWRHFLHTASQTICTRQRFHLIGTVAGQSCPQAPVHVPHRTKRRGYPDFSHPARQRTAPEIRSEAVPGFPVPEPTPLRFFFETFLYQKLGGMLQS